MTTQTPNKQDIDKLTSATQKIQTEPVINNLLSRMPDDVANSFTEKQLSCLLTAIGTRSWGKHTIDVRGALKIPLYRWHFYFVLLAGKNIRELTRREQQVSLIAYTLFTALYLIFSTLLGLLALYLIKSAAGVNLFPNFSLGIWSWFQNYLSSFG